MMRFNYSENQAYRKGYWDGVSDAVRMMREQLRSTHSTAEEILEEIEHGKRPLYKDEQQSK